MSRRATTVPSSSKRPSAAATSLCLCSAKYVTQPGMHRNPLTPELAQIGGEVPVPEYAVARHLKACVWTSIIVRRKETPHGLLAVAWSAHVCACEAAPPSEHPPCPRAFFPGQKQRPSRPGTAAPAPPPFASACSVVMIQLTRIGCDSDVRRGSAPAPEVDADAGLRPQARRSA